MKSQLIELQKQFSQTHGFESRMQWLKAQKLLGEDLFNLYRRGDLEEKYCIGRFLHKNQRGELFTEVAQMILRTNSQYILTSLLFDNDYPSQYFDEVLFKQLVLKGLFLNLDLNRLIGLEDRLTPSIIQSSFDYFQERKRAARSLPDSASIILNLNSKLKLIEPETANAFV